MNINHIGQALYSENLDKIQLITACHVMDLLMHPHTLVISGSIL